MLMLPLLLLDDREQEWYPGGETRLWRAQGDCSQGWASSSETPISIYVSGAGSAGPEVWLHSEQQGVQGVALPTCSSSFFRSYLLV